MKLHTEEAVAELFGLTPAKVADLRVRQTWPHVRLTRFDVRYTDDQLAEIIRLRSVAGEKAPSGTGKGLTARSARRSA